MKNRFSDQRSHTSFLRSTLTSVAIFAAASVLLMQGSSSMGKNAVQNQIDSLSSALKRSVIHCYAMEGSYPESLDYIQEHYGISWDPDKYVVDYEITGANLMPQISVFPVHREG